jgi:hypothetical protein
MQEDPNKVMYFAETDSRNRKIKFGIKTKDRSRHMYVIGKTGMGKSTLLENLAVQDIKDGHGMAFIDPHGKTAELLLEYIPDERKKDVIYLAPFDLENPISFNVLEDVGPDKRHLVANGLMSAFKRIWVDAWSARMEYILNNVMLALLETPGSTILGVNRMLADESYREKVVANVTDPSVRSFWVDEFAKYGPKYMQEAGAAIQNKIGQFISNPLVRNMVGQPKSAFDIRKVMDEGKILIINLSKGKVGEANANLIGAMLITKIYLAAMSRADVHESELEKLPYFYLFVDEFQNFANESFADILSEARKYKLALTIAHQYIEQMTEEVRAAVFGNVGSMVVFRVGAFDAEFLEKEFAPFFTQEDLVSLGFAQIYLKLMIDGVSSKPFSATTLPPVAKPLTNPKEEIIRPRASVEEDIRNWHLEMQADIEIDKKEKAQLRKKNTVDSALEAVLGHKPLANIVDVPKNDKEADALKREKDLRKAVSLSYLRQSNTPKPETKKVPTQEHLDELRKALVEIAGEKVVAKEPTPPIVEAKKEVYQTPETPMTPKVESSPKPKELPEDILRRVLKID